MTKKQVSRNGGSQAKPDALRLDTELFQAGDRVWVAVSGGADSTALLRVLLGRREELGIVLGVIHVHHGLRGASADEDANFVVALAERFQLPCEVVVVNTNAQAAERGETIEEAARNLRYKAFRELLNAGKAHKIATAHTLDDQAETVLMKLIRGAWTEGMSGIHPQLRLRETPDNRSDAQADCVRPFLAVRRTEIESCLRALGQLWREDASNRSLTHTRNRVRHELLPLMRQYNPQIDAILAQIASNAQAEEQHWHAELMRVLPHVLLPGKPVRGGGRTVGTRPGCASVAVDLAKLTALDLGLQRRVLRSAAKECGTSLDFSSTERLLEIAGSGRRGEHRSAKRLELPDGVRVERSARELQFERCLVTASKSGKSSKAAEASRRVEPTVYELVVPGMVDAPALGAKFTAEFSRPFDAIGDPPKLRIRAWKPGDRVELRHASRPKKVKEILGRMRLRPEDKVKWPVAVWKDRIVWMRGAEVSQMPLGGDENGGNHGNAFIFLIQEIRIDIEGSQEGKFSAPGRVGVK